MNNIQTPISSYDQIEKLSLSNPTIKAYWDRYKNRYKNNYCSYQEMLEKLVIHLADINDKLFEDVVQFRMKQPLDLNNI
jgi:hypothetical protein